MIQQPATLSAPAHNGHRIRKGHVPDVIEVTRDQILWTPVYRCCGQDIPNLEDVPTWADTIPPRPTLLSSSL